MSERDEVIGRNVVALRAGRSQKQIADSMRQRGHKWSQSTVWSVEKGERPLRLTEALDLSDLLDVDLALLKEEDPSQIAEKRLHEAVESFNLHMDSAVGNLGEFFLVRDQFVKVMIELHPEADPDELWSMLVRLVTPKAWDEDFLIRAAKAHAERIPLPWSVTSWAGEGVLPPMPDDETNERERANADVSQADRDEAFKMFVESHDQ